MRLTRTVLLVSLPLMIFVARAVLAHTHQRALGVIALVAPGMLLDTISTIWFAQIFPNIRADAAPLFKHAYDNYVKALNVRPSVTIVKVGQASDLLEKVCREKSVPLNVIEFRGDYYALPNVIPFLLQPSRVDLVLEIMEHPVPSRAS